MDPYYSRPEVSNSDLSKLKELLYPRERFGDIEKAYAFGNLIDAMITENDRVNYFKRTLDSYTYSREEMEQAEAMKKAFYRDEFCKMFIKDASFQHVSIQHNWPIENRGVEFQLNVRCKWDILKPKWKIGGDIKSTAAKTEKEFYEACEFFDYFRSRAWYMDIEGTDRDVLIGISKVNQKIFKIHINRGDKLYQKGKEEYQDLAFKYWVMFGDIKAA